jgi:hypothetical protein
MRLGRIILASLAPLFSIPASADAAFPAGSRVPDSGNFIRLLQSVVHLTAPAVESAAPSADRPSLHSVLAVTALADTPLRHSIWLVTAFHAAPSVARSQQRALLRC